MNLGHTERKGLCPFCEDKKGHLYMNEDTQCWICFKCNKKGIGKKLLEQKGIQWITEPKKYYIGCEESYTYEYWETVKEEILSKASDISALNTRALEYLESHHVSLKVAKYCRFKVWKQFLVFPGEYFIQIRYLYGKLFRTFGFKSRELIRYITTGEQFAGCVCVVESMVSAARLVPFVSSIALCGKVASLYQIELLRRYTYGQKVLIWLDSDAISYSMELVKVLTRGKTKVIPILSPKVDDAPGIDPCDLNDKQVLKILRETTCL